MADVFVSYSRRDKEFVEKLVAGLAQDGREVWVDWQDIPRAADWLNEIDKGIENSTSFIFVVSKNSLSSEICNHELEYALKFNKRIVPVIREDIAGNTEEDVKKTWEDNTWGKTAASNWSAVSHLNWIFFNTDEEERFKAEFTALIETLDSDLEHIKIHTRILMREREWEANAQKPGYLLAGEEIPGAETWLAKADSQHKEPQPTDLHREYILRSRATEDERLENLRRLETRTRQFRTAAVVLGVAIVAAIFAVFFAIQQSTRSTNIASTARADANEASTAVDNANATLSPIPPTLTESANEIAAANQLVNNANATLTPIPPTLTQAANDIADANEQLANAEQQVADANATLAPIPPTLTQSADDIAAANQQVATAESQIEIAEAELTSIPPTLDALDIEIADAEERVEALNLAAQALELGAAAGERLNEGNADLAALLAIESLKIDYNPGADNALVTASNNLFTEVLIPFWEGEASHGSINSNGSLAVFGFEDGTVNFWDAETNNLRPAGSNHPDYVDASVFVPDTPIAITGDVQGNVIFWNARTGAPLGEINIDIPITDLDVSPDGERLAIARNDGYFCIADIQSMEEEYCVETGDHIVNGLDFSPDGDYLVATFDIGADLWELGNDGAEFLEYYGDHRLITTDVAYSPDGNYILTASEDETMILWEVETGEELFQFNADTNVIRQVDFTPDGQYLITGSVDGTPRIWDMFNGRVVRSFGGHSNNIAHLSMTEDGRQLLSVSFDDSARIWNSDLRISRGVYSGHINWVTNLAFSPDGQYLASSSNDATIRVQDLERNRLFDMLDLDGYIPEGLVYLPDGSGILFDFDERLYLWEIGDDDIREYADLPGFPAKIRLTGDNQYAVIRAIGENTDYAGYLNLENGIYETIENESIADIALAQNRNVVAWIVDERTIALYDLDEEEMITRFDILDFGLGIDALALSPDASVAMIGSIDGLIAFVDTATGTIISQHREHTTNVSSIEISPDGLRAVSAGFDDRVIVWDMQSRSVLRVYNNHTNWVFEAIFSPDGSRIASGSVDKTVQVWFTSLEDLIANVCTNLSRDFLDIERARFGISPDNPTCG